MDIGQLGVWRRRQQGSEGVEEIEALGYGTLWLGASPSVEDARPYLEATESLTIATGILNVWRHDPAAVTAAHAEMTREHPGRFLLGVGIGHPESTSDYTRPLTTMRKFLDGLEGVPREQRIVAALGPKMLDLAARRSLGAHPYFVPVEHTRFAREHVGPDPIIATEVAVVVERDAETARRIARDYATGYLSLNNYASNLRRLGFDDADLRDGGSDRLIDVVIPHGSAEQIVEAVRSHLDAGASHVCVQPLAHGPHPAEDYRAIAAAFF